MLDRGATTLSLAEIVKQCREETGKFLRREESDERFCRELLRRAVCDRSEEAWAATFEQYRHLVLTWLRRHPARAGAGESDDFWLNRAFERFWRGVGPHNFATFPHLAALLRYLQMCVHGVIMDAARARRARTDAASIALLERAPGEGGVAGIVARISGDALWAAIMAETRDEVEALVARCCFVLDLKPGEVFTRHPGLFSSVADIYRIKRNLIDRLRRDAAVRSFLGAE